MPKARRGSFQFPDAPEGVLVSYSGGKDSLVVLDMTVKHYGAENVEAFFMYFVPDLDYSRAICGYAEERWGIRVHQAQHWNVTDMLREGVFCQERPDCPTIKVRDVEEAMRAKTKKHWIGLGYRKQESLERRGMLVKDWPSGIGRKRGGFAPIAEWSTKDVLAYVRRERLALHRIGSTISTGVGLDPETMWHMREHWPDDYRRILRVFPYAIAQADRFPKIREDKERKRELDRLARINARRLHPAGADDELGDAGDDEGADVDEGAGV